MGFLKNRLGKEYISPWLGNMLNTLIIISGSTEWRSQESSCGAIFFRKVMDDMGCTAKIVLSAIGTFLYSVRVRDAGDVYVFGMKSEVPMAALPA